MPRPTDIDPRTGKRYNFVPPEKRAPEARAAADIAVVDRQLAILERQNAALKARTSLLAYTRFTMPDPEAPNDVTRSRYEDERFHRLIATQLDKFLRGELLFDDGSVCTQLIFCMPPRHGKRIADDERVPTPNGFVRHGDLRAGDRVFGPDGKPTIVELVEEPAEGVVPVTFSNGAVVRCDLGHLWTVYDRAQRPGSRWRTMETREIAKRQLRNGPPGRGGRWTLQLPDVSALEYEPKDLSIPPYVLGAWLGDGSAACPRIAHAATDAEVIDACATLGYVPSKRFVQENTGVHYALFGHTGLRTQLRDLDVLNNKHIPERYLRSSIAQRLELLAGLIDTDGHVEAATGRVRFSTCSPELRDGVFDLAAGLGFRPHMAEAAPALSSSGIQGRKPVYQVGFQPNRDVPTRIPRKRIKKFAARRRVSIVSVGAEEPGSARCIKVARSDGLYLVGRHLIPTHNTEAATKRLVAQASGNHPEWDIAVASYSDTMAQDMGADTRAILTSPQHKQVFPTYRLRRGGTAKDNIQTDKGGRLVFVGRGGALTGRGMNLGVGDDLFKDHEEARSQAVRDQAWNWFTKVFMTRRMNPKLVLLTMTRWHSDDVIGRLTDPENPNYNASQAAKWKIIKLPAIAEDDDPIGRKKGEALWPARYDISFLESQRELDALGFEALYQQNPTVADGVLFRRENIRYYKPTELPEKLRIYCASDHAVATGQRNDYTALLKIGIDAQENIYLLDLYWNKVKSDVAVEAMLTMASGNMAPLLWWAERGQISKSIGPFLYKRMRERGTYINLIEVTPAVDKEQRAQSIAARVAMGKVFWPQGAHWTERSINELMAFPNGNHDDFVDALAYIGLGLRFQHKPSSGPKVEQAPPFGSFAWVKQQEKYDQQQKDRRDAGGF